ncbi:DUF6252 family protein [Limibacter armeniacum]|uniref:DUF6252 family protein n=1 Tax=Limibacter armeniacum TaxID=466084 RepID=UPI002FE57069
MIKKYCLTIISLFTIWLLVSCDETSLEPTTKKFSATINGQGFEANEIVVVQNGSTLSISASSGNKALQIILNNYDGLGEYSLGGNANNNEGKWEAGLGNGGTFTTLNTNQNSGMVHVTSSTASSVKGNFDFSAISGNNTVNVTDGVFDLQIESMIEN